MIESLKVLIIEDSIYDTELILDKLTETSNNIEHVTVDNEIDMRKALTEKSWDIVLCDYSMPSFDPYMALSVLKDFNLDIPFIVISGTIGEENIVKLMKIGCHDCVMKDNLGRIPSVVNREIVEAQIRNENRCIKVRLQKYQLLSDNTNDSIFFLNKDGRILETNDAAVKKYLYSRDEFLTMGLHDLTHVDNMALILKQIKLFNNTGFVFEEIHYRKDNSKFEVEVSSQGSLIDGELVVIGVVRDISERKSAERDLMISEERFRTIFEQSPFGIAHIDSFTGHLNNANFNFLKIIDRSLADLQKVNMNSLINSIDLNGNMPLILSIMKGERDNCNFNMQFKRHDASFVWLDISLILIVNKEPHPFYLCIIEDITGKMEKEKRIEYLIYHDALTKLKNRLFFQEATVRLDNVQYLPLSYITGDINGLKLINDALGHVQGDKLLIEMSKILTKCTRGKDILARVGGDEFSILMPNTTSEEAQEILNSIYATCKEYKDKSHNDIIYLSISLGCATKNIIDDNIAFVIKTAEDRMYKRKLLEHKSFHSSLISYMRTTLFEKSKETERHAERLIKLAHNLGVLMGINEEKLGELELLATLHDIGKISIDDRILLKPGKLDDNEWMEIKKHPVIGYRIAMASPELEAIADYILCHHEQWDGNGYSQGLAGENIPLLSRIIFVVDAFDAMTKDRVYRKGMPVKDALEELVNNSGVQFDPSIVSLFVQMIKDNNELAE